MAEFFDAAKEKIINVNEPIVFENKTDSSFDVSTGIVFHKSGIYEISIVGRRTIVSKVTESKTGKWIYDGDCYICNKCKSAFNWWADSQTSNYCPSCGARMLKEGEDHETD